MPATPRSTNLAAASGSPDAELRGRIREPALDRSAIARFLDDLSPDDRVRAIRGIGRSDQRRLYQAALGFAPVHLNELVPPERPAMTTVRPESFRGRNIRFPGQTSAITR